MTTMNSALDDVRTVREAVAAVRLPWHTATVEQCDGYLYIGVSSDEDSTAAHIKTREALAAVCEAIGFGQAAFGRDVVHSGTTAGVYVAKCTIAQAAANVRNAE